MNRKSIKERLMYYVESQGIDKNSFFKKLDVTSASFRGNALMSHLSSKYLIIIVQEYDINPRWLLTGDGPMVDNEKDFIKDDGYREKYFKCLEEQNELLKENADLKNIQSADTVFTKRKLKE